jgi:hypothetical protein
MLILGGGKDPAEASLGFWEGKCTGWGGRALHSEGNGKGVQEQGHVLWTMTTTPQLTWETVGRRLASFFLKAFSAPSAC